MHSRTEGIADHRRPWPVLYGLVRTYIYIGREAGTCIERQRQPNLSLVLLNFSQFSGSGSFNLCHSSTGRERSNFDISAKLKESQKERRLRELRVVVVVVVVVVDGQMEYLAQ